MKILIIGSGGREYSIALKLVGHKLYFAPGSDATSKLGTNLSFQNFDDLGNQALSIGIDLTIVGPEEPLINGVVDIFKYKNLKIFGPSKEASRLEASKIFMKDFAFRNNIRTAKFLNTNDFKEASDFINNLKLPIVIKADGICAGKGVIIANNYDEAKSVAKNMLDGKSFGNAGKNVVIEEFIDGFELSFFVISDGENFISLPVAQDHKRLLDSDNGPNTGGMGAYAPSILADKNLIKKIEDQIISPSIKAMKKEGREFCGVLFAGIMVKDNEPYLLEFNVRFGDPECEVLMPLIKGDLAEILLSASNGKLVNVEIEDKFAVGVVLANKDYPFAASEPSLITINNIPKDSHIVYAGVKEIDNEIYASGGRVIVCVGVDENFDIAIKKAYELCESIKFNGMQYRKDIGYQILRLKNDK